MKTLVLPEAEVPFTYNAVYFSRLFLSKWLGGSPQPAFTNVSFDPNQNRVYLLEAYYVGVREWSPQYPKRAGENGALLIAGKSFEKPPVPWQITTGRFPVGHRSMARPFNCFVKRSSAEYEYIGCYLFHAEFRKLTKEEVERNVPKTAWDLWTNAIDRSQWGEELKGKSESRKSEELFKLPDDDSNKLCFYWEVGNSPSNSKDLLRPIFSIWSTLVTTNACIMLSVRRVKK